MRPIDPTPRSFLVPLGLGDKLGINIKEHDIEFELRPRPEKPVAIGMSHDTACVLRDQLCELYGKPGE